MLVDYEERECVLREPQEEVPEALTKWDDDSDNVGKEIDDAKKKELEGMVKVVNSTQKCPTTETNDIIATTDIEGCPRNFLCNLKAAGMINSVALDKNTGRLKIELSKDWRGALAFCGDLTSYKNNCEYNDGPYGNEIMVEVLEELLDQLEKHNKQIIEDNNTLPQDKKQEEAKFVAVPGNHEFLRYWGIDDSDALFGQERDEKGKVINSNINPSKRVLRVKVRAVRVLAKIQKYYLEQALKNGYDIKDNDYGDRNGDAFRNLNSYIKELDNYIKDCETLLNNIDDATRWETIKDQLYKIHNTYITGKSFDSWEERNNLDLLNVLKWRHNKLFSKMMLCHRGKKLRLLHSLSLFAPKTIFPDDWSFDKVREGTKPYEDKYYKLTEEIGENLNDNIVNLLGVMYKYLPKEVINYRDYGFDHSAFAKNKISTIWGHKCDQKAVSDSKQVCFDDGLVEAPMFYIDKFGIVYRWNTSLQKLAVLRDQKNNIFQLSMPTAKTTIEEPENARVGDLNGGDEMVNLVQNNNDVQNNSHDNRAINQPTKEQLAEEIITAIIDGEDAKLGGLQDQFNQQRIDNEFLISALRRYNENNGNIIKRYGWWGKLFSFGENNAKKRRINHLGKMLYGRFTKNMDRQEKKQYKKQYQQDVEEHDNKMKKFKQALSEPEYQQLKNFLAPLPKYGKAKMKEIRFSDLLNIAQIQSRLRCGCCGRGSVEVQQ